MHLEDSYLWRSPRGWHAIFHSDVTNEYKGVAGGHAFAESFEGPWHFSHDNAYGNEVALTDGRTVKLLNRERPKLLLTPDGQPHYLSNGAKWLVGREGEGGGCDRTFTLVQPIAQH